MIDSYTANPYDSNYAVSVIDMAVQQQSADLYQLISLAINNCHLEEKYLLKLFQEIRPVLEQSQLMKLYSQVIEQTYYIDLGMQFVQFLTEIVLPRKTGEMQFEKLLTVFCYDYFHSHVFFDAYISFERKMLEIHDQTKPIHAQILNLHNRRLKIPNVKSQEQWKEFQLLYPAEIDKMTKIHEHTISQLNEQFERDIRQAKQLENIEQLLNDKKIDVAKAFNYLDIVLYSNVCDLNIISQIYQRIAKQNTNIQVLSKIYRKLTKFTIDFPLYKAYIRSLDQTHAEYTILENEFQRLNYFLPNEQQFLLYVEFVNVYSRQYTQQLEDKQDKNSLQELIRAIYTRNTFEQKQLSHLHNLLGKIEIYLFGNKINSRNQFELSVKLNSDDSAYWRDYISALNAVQFESLAHRDRLRTIYKRASEVVKDDKLQSIQDWINFEHLFGSVEELIKAEEKYVKVVEQQLNKPDESESEEQQQKIENQESDRPVNKIYVDSEKTVFVKHLPKEFTAEDVIKLLGDELEILECRIVKDKQSQSKGFAYLDFASEEHAAQGAKILSKKVVQGEQLYAAQSKPPKLYTNDQLTLYIDNLPYSVTEDALQVKCGAGVKEVRLIRDDKGKPKGYGYVEFNTIDNLKESLQSLKQSPFMDGRKIFVEQSDSLEKIKEKQLNQVVLIKNLPFKCREQDLKQLFDGMNISQIVIAKDKEGKPRGFAFVEFEKQKDFKNALEMNGLELKGRQLEIIKSDRKVTGGISYPKVELPAGPKSNSDFKKLFQ